MSLPDDQNMSESETKVLGAHRALTDKGEDATARRVAVEVGLSEGATARFLSKLRQRQLIPPGIRGRRAHKLRTPV